MLDIKKNLTAINQWPDRSGQKVKAIIMHSMDGFYNGTLAWFRNPDSKVSTHYIIKDDGEISKCVEEEAAAWHSGDVKIQKNEAPKAIRDAWGVNVNNISIGIELEDKRDRNWPYPSPQYTAAVLLTADVCKRNKIKPSRDTIIMHKELNPKDRFDPIGQWNHDRFVSDVKNSLLKGGETEIAYYPLEATVTVADFIDTLYVRKEPNTKAKLAGSKKLTRGNVFKVKGFVKGERVNYSDSYKGLELSTQFWWHSNKGNYVWCGGTTVIPTLDNYPESVYEEFKEVVSKPMNKAEYEVKIQEFEGKLADLKSKAKEVHEAMEAVEKEYTVLKETGFTEEPVVEEVKAEETPVDPMVNVVPEGEVVDSPVEEIAEVAVAEPVAEVVEEAPKAETTPEVPEEAKDEARKLIEEIKAKFGL